MEERNPKTNFWTLFGISANIWICCWQGGFCIGGNNVVGEILADQMNWGDNKDRNNTIISSLAIAGGTIGSLASGTICEIGRRRSILLCNVVVIISTAMMLVLNLWVIFIARFMQAVAAGVILSGSNLYLAETIPVHKRTIFGVALNLGTVSGLLITSLMGLAMPLAGTPEAKTTQLWRVSVGFGIVPAILTSIVWLFIFKKESLKYIVQRGDKNKEALSYLKQIYNLEREE